MMIYAQSRFKPKKRKRIRGEVAHKLDRSKLHGTEMPDLTYVPRPAAEFARAHQSLNAHIGNTDRKEIPVYSGSRRLIGIGVMHKSNMVPIFSAEEATDIARMRRG